MTARTNAQEERLATIERHRQHANTLTKTAKHDSIRGLIRLAVRDLDEGAVWLQRDIQPEQEPWILAMVDFQIHLAVWRLNTADWALRTYGPDAMLIG
jgi:hypothetical protein